MVMSMTMVMLPRLLRLLRLLWLLLLMATTHRSKHAWTLNLWDGQRGAAHGVQPK